MADRHRTRPIGYCNPGALVDRLRQVTYQPAPQFGTPQPPPGPNLFGLPHPPQPPRKPNHGIWIVVAAGVLGVFVFCGIVVAAAGNTGKPTRTEDVARNGALAAPTSAAPAPTETTITATTAAPTTAAATTAPA